MIISFYQRTWHKRIMYTAGQKEEYIDPRTGEKKTRTKVDLAQYTQDQSDWNEELGKYVFYMKPRLVVRSPFHFMIILIYTVLMVYMFWDKPIPHTIVFVFSLVLGLLLILVVMEIQIP